MQITGQQLLFLVRVLKDSLDIQMGYDWNFHDKRDQRKIFYDRLIESLVSQQSIEIQEVDVSKLNNFT